MNDSGNKLRDRDEPWRDKELLLDLYEEQGLTYEEIGDLLGCGKTTVSSWMKKHRADEYREDLDVEIPDEYPYRDGELLEYLYLDEELSTTEIAAVLDCSTGAVINWLNKHDIETRSTGEGVSKAYRGPRRVNFYTHGSKGYEMVKGDEYPFPVHRLQAIAYWGIDAVKGNQVHHKNGIEWDNREDNLEVLNARDHIGQEHAGNIWLDRLRAVEMYREGLSSYDVAPALDVSSNTVIRWVREFDPDLIRSKGGA